MEIERKKDEILQITCINNCELLQSRAVSTNIFLNTRNFLLDIYRILCVKLQGLEGTIFQHVSSIITYIIFLRIEFIMIVHKPDISVSELGNSKFD